MKKTLLIAVAALALIASPSFADQGRGERGGDHGDRGEHHEHQGDRGGFHDNHGGKFDHGYDRHGGREYHGWAFGFAMPGWIVGVPYCRDYTIINTYVDVYGQYYNVLETHTEIGRASCR